MIANALLPRLGLGTAALGHLYRAVEDSAAEATIRAAYDAGIRFFDTAHLYGGGLAEQRLGRVLRTLPRDSYRLATKIGAYRPFGQGPIPPGSTIRRAADEWDFSEARSEAALVESFRRLGTDHIDIVHVHSFDRHMDEARDGAFQILARHKTAGSVGKVGAGTDDIRPLVEVARSGLIDAVLTAGRHTLIDHTAATTLFPIASTKSIEVVVGGVLNSGILATGATAQAHFDYSPAPPEILARVRKVEALCAEAGIPLRAAALQFPLRNPIVSISLIGPSNPAELEDCLAMLAVPIGEDFWAALEALQAMDNAVS